MLELPDVTIFSMIWESHRQWVIKIGQVLRYCRSIMNPGKMILFTNEKIANRDYPWETVLIPKLNWQSYNIFINRVIPNYIKTSFAMSVHEDGFPINVGQWSSEFLQYDYIGAPWDDGAVGNGGFNMESRKLMDLKSVMPMTDEDFSIPSDRLICTTRRKYLEDHGIKFAPFEVALRFSTEQVGNDKPSFGFHGRTASPQKYHQGWTMINQTPRATYQRDTGFTREGNKVVPAKHFARFANPALNVPSPNGELTAAIVYVFPVNAGVRYDNWAKRFVDSYSKNPPEYPHRSFVVLNNGYDTPQYREMFKPLMNLHLVHHNNTGYDIGAFQRMARENPNLDVLVCFGSSTYFKGKGWLKRMVGAYRKRGLALYGVMGNTGNMTVRVFPHIRTTGFWIKPSLFNQYPRQITKPQQRYEFEHGRESLSEWIRKQGLERWVVSWDQEYDVKSWNLIPNGYHRGNQSNMLCGDRLTEPPYYATA